MENMKKELTVPKWVPINWAKISQMPTNLFAQILCPSPKVWDFDEKMASIGVCSPRFLCRADQAEIHQIVSMCRLDICDVRGVAERGRNCSLNFYVSGFDIFDWLKTWTSFCMRYSVSTVAYIVFIFGSCFNFQSLVSKPTCTSFYDFEKMEVYWENHLSWGRS